MSVAVAEGVEGGGGEAQAAGECLGSDDDDSSVMASLIAMFPSLDYEVGIDIPCDLQPPPHPHPFQYNYGLFDYGVSSCLCR